MVTMVEQPSLLLIVVRTNRRAVDRVQQVEFAIYRRRRRMKVVKGRGRDKRQRQEARGSGQGDARTVGGRRILKLSKPTPTAKVKLTF